MMKNRTLLLTQTALLGACALVLSMLESFLPQLLPALPGARAGLSNIAVMLGMQLLGLAPALIICVLKAIFAFATRGGAAMIMSLCGGILSTIVMYAMLMPEKSPFGCVGIGIGGALAHNIAQLCIAYFLVGRAVLFYTPFLILISLITGSITGISMGLLMPGVGRVFALISGGKKRC